MQVHWIYMAFSLFVAKLETLEARLLSSQLDRVTAVARGNLSSSPLYLLAMQFTKALVALAAVFGAVFQLQGCGAATTEAPGNTSNSTRMLEDAELLA